ncbi:MAG: hypothetical protein IJ373_00795 [Clostridia bacterium]|nr:hypothetical protein [Clostridia bacterium]MBQ8446998.1 hypothetical protein [Clostridia bacterium]
MSKTIKPKKDKVPKISEEEYVAYLSALKNMTEGVDGGDVTGVPTSTQGKEE